MRAVDEKGIVCVVIVGGCRVDLNMMVVAKIFVMLCGGDFGKIWIRCVALFGEIGCCARHVMKD